MSNIIVDGEMVVTSEIIIGECICMIMKEMKGLQFLVCSDSYVVMGLVLQVVRNFCVAEYFSLWLYAMYTYDEGGVVW